jgi:hypothetical protein
MIGECENMRCPFCGSHLDDKAKYCNECGTAVDSECSGKNINYRSYTDTRPSSTPQKTKVHTGSVNPNKVRENPFVEKKPIGQMPPVSNLPSAAFARSQVNTKKKSGCGTALVVVIILSIIITVIIPIIGPVLFKNDSDFDDNNSYNYDDYSYEEGETDFGGRIDGKYYLNDKVNLAFVIPEGFEESDGDNGVHTFTEAEYYLESGKDYILTGTDYSDNAEEFLDFYSSDVYYEMSKSDWTDDYDSHFSDITDKKVGDTELKHITATFEDKDGEQRVSDTFAVVSDGRVFFVEINTTDGNINKQVIDSFVNAYETD